MIDPLAEVVGLLQLSARFSKLVRSAGHWRVRRYEPNQPFYCAVLEGAVRFQAEDGVPIVLEANDFILAPVANTFTMSSLEPPADESEPSCVPVAQADGSFRIGEQEGPASAMVLIGHSVSESPDAELLFSLLPKVVHVRNERRLATLVQMVRDESRERRPARDEILSRLMEVVFIEALRSSGTSASPGLVRGLADVRLAQAIRRMHEAPEQRWTVVQLATVAALSRSAFFERFSREVGVAPMEYLLSWRMALAKRYLRDQDRNIADIAERVGYGSASAFSVAFTRHTGVPPTHYAREQQFAPEAIVQ